MNLNKVIEENTLFFVSILLAGITVLIYTTNSDYQNSYGIPTIFVDEYEEQELLNSNVTTESIDLSNASTNGNNLTAIQPIQPINNMTQ